MAKKMSEAPGDSGSTPRRRTPRRRSTAAAPRSTAPNSERLDPTHREIAEVAYRRFLNRGAAHGRDFDDWVEAERELRGQHESH